MNQDWTGTMHSIYKTLGASNHTDEKRQQDDFYATDPIAAHYLLELETFSDVWECACGEGHLSKVFIDKGIDIRSSDLIDRGYGEVYDFLSPENKEWYGDIVTNPPYKYAQQFIEKALSIIRDGDKVAMFLKVQFLEGKARKKLFLKYPPKTVYISSSRILCAKNGNFRVMINNGGSAVAYAWFVWQKGFIGDSVIKWFN